MLQSNQVCQVHAICHGQFDLSLRLLLSEGCFYFYSLACLKQSWKGALLCGIKCGNIFSSWGTAAQTLRRFFHWQRQASHSTEDVSLRPDPAPSLPPSTLSHRPSFTPWTSPTSVYYCLINSSLGLKLHFGLCLLSKRETQLQLSCHCQALPACNPFGQSVW